jgi:hypothetical protein
MKILIWPFLILGTKGPEFIPLFPLTLIPLFLFDPLCGQLAIDFGIPFEEQFAVFDRLLDRRRQRTQQLVLRAQGRLERRQDGFCRVRGRGLVRFRGF